MYLRELRTIQVVTLGLGFNVEVPWHTVHHQVPRNLTTRMIGAVLLEQQSLLLSLIIICGIRLMLPILKLLIHFKLSLGKCLQSLQSSIHFVVWLNGCALVVPAECRKCHDFLLPT